MVAAVRVHKPGGPEVLTYEDVQIAAPGQGQIKIKQHAAGVNFIDAYFRMQGCTDCERCARARRHRRGRT